MPGLLRPILAPMRRLVAAARPAPPAATSPAAPRLARRLADAIDQATILGQWEHADRLAQCAAPMADRCARLAEPLARLRLAQGDPETALRIIDACRTRSASLRMLRAACLVFLGARSEASLDLLRWSRLSAAPLEARLLLALLERSRDQATALQALQRNLRHLEDPRTLEALLLLSVERRHPQQADRWATRLAASCAGGAEAPVADLMLESLGMAGLGALEEPAREHTSALAMELIAFEPAIRTLTEASRRRPHVPTLKLLRGATERALPDLADPAAAFHALARLSILLGRPDEAAAFAARGLAANPMSAALSILARQLREMVQAPVPVSTGSAAGSAAATFDSLEEAA